MGFIRLLHVSLVLINQTYTPLFSQNPSPFLLKPLGPTIISHFFYITYDLLYLLIMSFYLNYEIIDLKSASSWTVHSHQVFPCPHFSPSLSPSLKPEFKLITNNNLLNYHNYLSKDYIAHNLVTPSRFHK